MGSRYGISFKDFIQLTPRQADLMHIEAVESINSEHKFLANIHGVDLKKPKWEYTNKLRNVKDPTADEMEQMKTATQQYINQNIKARLNNGKSNY